jgi:hypothetical protein
MTRSYHISKESQPGEDELQHIPGIGTSYPKVRNEVCDFAGEQVFYVVRDRGFENHEFIGEYYVHGMVDGEASRCALNPGKKFVLM